MIAALLASTLFAVLVSGSIAYHLAPFIAVGLMKQKPLTALVHPLDLTPMKEVSSTADAKRERARKALESRYNVSTKSIEGAQTRKSITASRQTPVPTPVGMSLPESDLVRLQDFAKHVEATRVEAEKSGDIGWLREVLTLRNRLAENVQAFQDASTAGAPDEEAVTTFLANIRHMENHMQGLLAVRVQDAKKKLRTLTSYYENKSEEGN